jgi:hypothetical protein
MAMTDEEREFRLRPRKPPVACGESKRNAGTSGFKMLMHFARQSRTAIRQGSSSGRRSFPHRQRCAVRITYSKNKGGGQWRAHGRYLERERAALGASPGFDARDTGVQISTRLQSWQANKDELLWKFIISPEFGDRADLQRLTRELMGSIEKDLGGPIEWAAVAHHNTEHPHVHIALRGKSANGSVLRLNRDYIKRGVRDIAEDLCTRQLGYRTSLDAAEAERREINETRFTSLDRAILRRASPSDSGPVLKQALIGKHHIQARLLVLQRMGLAMAGADSTWQLRPDTAQVLRAMQRTSDRQRTLATHGALVSDERLAIEAIDWRRIESVEGRVLVHGEEEHSGKNYLMLESTAGVVYYIPYTAEIEKARRVGSLKANSFVRLRRQVPTVERSRIEVEDFGDAEILLTDRRLLREKLSDLESKAVSPAQDGWGGWLGRYQRVLCGSDSDEAWDRGVQETGRGKRRRALAMER